MRTLADIAAIAATILAVASLVPQIRKLRRLGSAEGVSPTWAALGAATNVAWFAYLFHEALWASVPAPFLMTGFYAATFNYVHRAGKAFGRSALASAAWGAALFVSLVVGGWTFLGLVLGGSYVVQVAPSVWAAYRTRRPSSVAPATLDHHSRRGGVVGPIRLVPLGRSVPALLGDRGGGVAADPRALCGNPAPLGGRVGTGITRGDRVPDMRRTTHR